MAKICVVIARGLAFLYEESTLKIVHGDFKSTNVLLVRDLNPKISILVWPCFMKRTPALAPDWWNHVSYLPSLKN